MSNKKEQNVTRMNDFLTEVEKHVTQLGLNLQHLIDFQKFSQTEEYKSDSILKSIVDYVQYVSISEIILTLDRLFEPPSDGKESIMCNNCGKIGQTKIGKKILHFINYYLFCFDTSQNKSGKGKYGERSFIWYINQLKEHSTSFEKPQRFTNEELDEQLKEIEDERANLKIIGKYRDKWFAHRDKKYFDNPMKLWVDEPLNINVLESTVGLAKRLVEQHFSKIRGVGKIWNAEHISVLSNIIFIRQKMLEYSKNNEKLYAELRNCQDGK